VTLQHDVAAGAVLTYDDVEIDPSNNALSARKEMESAFKAGQDN
jgi:predicted homoserine dehydrogenase-like protein